MDDQRLAEHLQLAELQATEQEEQDLRLARELQAHEQEPIPQLQLPEQPREGRVIPDGRQARIHCCRCAPALPARVRAAEMRSQLRWHSVVEGLLGAGLLVFLASSTSSSELTLALGLASLVAPACGLAAARWCTWHVAVPHLGATACVVVVRAAVMPMSTANWLHAASAVACSSSTLYALVLALRWLILLW